MNFDLNDDQQALTEGIRSFLDGRFDIESVRSYETRGTIDRDRWRELGDTGVFSLRLAEADGGIGLGAADAALVFEQLGASLVPGPLVGQHLAAGVIDGAADGSVVVGLVAEPDGAVPVFVEHLDSLDTLLVVGSDSVRAVEAGAVRASARAVARPTDPLTPVHRVDALPAGDAIIGADRIDRDVAVATTLTAAMCVGLASRATDLAVAYAKERHQFDRPIGSFQAVKHLLADMLVAAEVARAGVYSAAVHIDDPSVGDVARAVRSAKVVAGDAAINNGKTAIQVHGGMGFTWEVDAHLLLKRAWVLDTHFGSSDEHSLAIASSF